MPEGGSGDDAGRRTRLGAYLTELLSESVTVDELERIEGGWSRQTHRVVATNPAGAVRKLALRGEVANSLLDTDLEREWRILQCVAGTGIPLPEVFGFEPTAQVLGYRFVTMGWVDGISVNPWRMKPEERAASQASGPALADAWLADVAKLHAADVQPLRDKGIDPDVDAELSVTMQVQHWTSIVREAAFHPGPLLEAACKWLETNVPAPAGDPSIVHGDLRIGNMLVESDRVVAFLDWEMGGIGDWRADIGYSLMPYNAGKFLEPIPPSANQLMAPRAFLDLYQAKSGRTMSNEEVVYFIVLGSTKMIAILCTGIDAYMHKTNADPRLAWTSLAVPGLVSDIVELIEKGLPW